MGRQFSSEELFELRNGISIRSLIAGTLGIPSKEVEGVFRFLCPKCREFQTAVNPKTNLSRCFRCEQNYNTIEIVMKDKQVNFVQRVKFLKQPLGRVDSPVHFGKIHAATSDLDIS